MQNLTTKQELTMYYQELTMYYNESYKAPTLKKLALLLANDEDELVVEDDIEVVYFKPVNGKESQLTQCEMNDFVDLINDIITDDIEEGRSDREHIRLERMV